MKAEEWYTWFLEAYAKDKKLQSAYGRKGDITPREWSDLMFDLLQNLAKEKGFDVGRETLRVDMTWKEGAKVMVAIEHENRANKVAPLIDKEVKNLLTISTPLMVLITYFDGGIFNKSVQELKDKILDTMKDMHRFDSEFLLIASPWDIGSTPSDQFWIAHVYRPSVDVTSILYPPYICW